MLSAHQLITLLHIFTILTTIRYVIPHLLLLLVHNIVYIRLTYDIIIRFSGIINYQRTQNSFFDSNYTLLTLSRKNITNSNGANIKKIMHPFPQKLFRQGRRFERWQQGRGVGASGWGGGVPV